ncbi:uncharacterized protein LOC113752036 [Coffea eugenioides]|uniref:uncharacterized protein LOC113752036 n=1 Tax=Coffea eugenioides TaxID=49369 RepID=UPI000F608BE6|nr:uncharacterized protein LOC113752036 [Coffea eugenioides]
MADNFLLAQELLSDIKKPNRGGNVLLKLDMMKAYDRGFFKSTRGLRQGDPISPALFVIGAELVKMVVDGYCSLSGQQVNCQESCFLVHPKLPPQRREMIGSVTGFLHKSFPIKYLGCPLYIGRRRVHCFADICNAVTARIFSWKNRVLSSGGKLVLLRSVLSSMPIHLLAAASSPKGVFASLEKVMADFLWGSSEVGPRFQWISWGELCRPPEAGGVGIRSIAKVYDAFSIKL